MRFHKTLRTVFVSVFAGILASAGLSTAAADDKKTKDDPAKIQSKAKSAKPSRSVSELIRLLDSKDYQSRNAAGRDLVRHGGAAVEALAKAARSSNPEVSVRSMTILEHIYADLKSADATVEKAEAALEALRESKLPQIGGRAATVLARHTDLRQRRAIAAVKRLGGIVRYYNTELLLGGAPGGFPQPPQSQQTISFVLLGDKWKGGDDGVKYLKRIAGLRNLYVAQNKKFQPISDKARADLQAAIPTLSIQLRGLACLGVRGSVTTVNGAGCIVTSVDAGSAAAKGMVRANDKITRIAGKPVDSFESLVKQLADYSPNDKVEIEVLRQGRTLKLTIVLQGWKK